jgi:hypothetical protein
MTPPISTGIDFTWLVVVRRRQPIDSGFRIAKLSEPEPPPEMQNEPDGQDDRRRPTFLLIAALKTPTP